MNMDAKDLPRVRALMTREISERGPSIYDWAIRDGMQTHTENLGLDNNGRTLARFEVHRLRLAELYWVSAGMAELARVAAETLPGFVFGAEDLPSPFGLVVFETPTYVNPLPHPTDPTMPSQLTYGIAHSWGPHWISGAPSVWITHYTDTRRNGNPSGIDEATWRRTAQRMPLALDTETQLTFGRATGGEDVVTQFGVAQLVSLWLLMKQPLASIERADIPRAERRRVFRETGADAADVRIIRLRSPKGTATGTSDRDYHHRWIVRGHWRQQWYPTIERHRPVWINPHVKGPDGAPLLGGERVYAVVR